MKVGQVVYVKRVGNAARRRDEKDLVTEETIEKVGNKYFYLKGYYRYKFSIEEKRDISEYSSNFIVYESMKEIEEETEYFTKVENIRKIFERYGRCSLSLDQIRRINNIIQEDI
jgi:hypothetical protein